MTRIGHHFPAFSVQDQNRDFKSIMRAPDSPGSIVRLSDITPQDKELLIKIFQERLTGRSDGAPSLERTYILDKLSRLHTEEWIRLMDEIKPRVDSYVTSSKWVEEIINSLPKSMLSILSGLGAGIASFKIVGWWTGDAGYYLKRTEFLRLLGLTAGVAMGIDLLLAAYFLLRDPDLRRDVLEGKNPWSVGLPAPSLVPLIIR